MPAKMPPPRPAGRAACKTAQQQGQHGTSLLDLPDDMFGLIYAHLPDEESRRAFRQCCTTLHRSPSINARLEHFGLGECKGIATRRRGNERPFISVMMPESIVEAILRHPKHAAIKELGGSFHGTRKADYAQLLGYLARAPDRFCKAARARLTSVKAMDLQDLDCGAAEASAVLTVFPQLEELRLYGGSYSNDFFSLLASHGSIQRLELSRTRCNDGPDNAMAGIAQMTGLRALSLWAIPNGSNVMPLASLRHLRHLSVHFCSSLVGLGHAVCSAPLTSMSCGNLTRQRSLGPGERLASDTLTELTIPSLSDDQDWLGSLECPRLKVLRFDRVQVGDWLPETVALKDLDNVLSVVRKHDLVVHTSSCSSFRFSIGRSSRAFQAAVLERLCGVAALRSFFAGINSLCFSPPVMLDATILNNLAALVPNLTDLTLESPSLHDQVALPDLLFRLPHLKRLRLENENEFWAGYKAKVLEPGMRVVKPEEVLALLRTARDARRELVLDVVACSSMWEDSDEESSSESDVASSEEELPRHARAFKQVEKEWAAEVRKQPPQLPVRAFFSFRRIEEEEE